LRTPGPWLRTKARALTKFHDHTAKRDEITLDEEERVTI
jgi:hypothetical protein